jgi:hypothetical protein
MMFTRRFTVILASAALMVAAGLGVWWLRHRNGGSSAPADSSSSHQQSTIHHPEAPPNHPVVARILKDGPTMPYLKFNYLIKEIPTNLAPHDIDALCSFISGPQPQGFQDGEWGSLVNDIEEALTVQTTPSEKVARTLSAIYRDETKSQLQRDYALQHIGGFAIFLVHTGGKQSGKQKAESGNSSSPQSPISNIQSLLLSELRHATATPANPWAGTALNLLDGILRAAASRGTEVPGLSAESLASLALPMAQNPVYPLNTRLPALQLIGRHRAPQAAPLARQLLADPASPIMLVQASAAVLAQCGTPDDLPLLEQHLNTATPHTRPALAEAAKTLKAKAPCSGGL